VASGVPAIMMRTIASAEGKCPFGKRA